MERDVMDIIRDKEFIELTDAERAELGELCSSEEEFDQVKSMFAGMSAVDWSNPTPKAETKASLDHLFAQKHSKAAPVWYNAPLAVLAPKGKPFYRQPLIQAAAVGLLIFLAYPLVNSNVMESKTDQVAALDEEITSSETKKTNKLEREDVGDSDEADEMVMDAEIKVSQTVSEQDVLDDVPPAPVPLTNFATAPVSAQNVELLSGMNNSKDVLTNREDATQPGSTHPDGIFIADKAEVFSVPASHEPAVFDLLTSTF